MSLFVVVLKVPYLALPDALRDLLCGQLHGVQTVGSHRQPQYAP